MTATTEFRTVYRLERGGEGCFTSGLVREATDSGNERDKHACDPHAPPDPWGERGALAAFFSTATYEERKPYLFAFRDLEQYRRWFDCEALRRDLAALGGVLKGYRVPTSSVIEGEWQVVFHGAQAEVVETLSPVLH